MKKIILLVITLFFCEVSFADTVFLSNGSVEKGLVVEEYSDRIVLNTESGPKEILKKDVKNISYDTQEQNLMQIGKINEDRGDFKNAIYYYLEALKLDPNSRVIKDALERTQGKSLQNYSESTKEAVEEKLLAEDFKSKGEEVLSEKGLIERIKDATGMVLQKNNSFVEVSKIEPDSVSFKLGIVPKDKIINVWGLSIIYEDFYRSLREIDGPENSLLKLTIQREIVLTKIENMQFTLKIEGLFIAKSSNPLISENDRVSKIKDKDAAYISVKQAEELLKGIENYPLRITIQRTLYLTRK